MKQNVYHRPEFFYTTAPLPCPYLPGRMERRLVTELVGRRSVIMHDALSRAGFRRSHNIAYAPICPTCQACVAVRIVTADFTPSRTQRRLIRMNSDLIEETLRARGTLEQFTLFEDYQNLRHGDGDMASMTFRDYKMMVEDSPIDTFVAEFRHPDDDRLAAACLTDRMADGFSAVYSFFEDDESRRSLGTYMVLWLVDQARRAGLPYVYLGYWIAETRKMAYKTNFRPLEALTAEGWQPIEETGLI
ncbi:arginyltransferase [Magnetospira sp. QH-2]|uniref:arginyltransferase n=1 Tax=Magnetospira sp. (strain QH-2) TaxID=1288970 RepID=UPI0003E818A0|nr:arginyltransferase [Magnetospira sp. QH-2]CCQ73857.1 putative arginyl-tRNA--protein transferase [Magnetospira sp. QH-2]